MKYKDLADKLRIISTDSFLSEDFTEEEQKTLNETIVTLESLEQQIPILHYVYQQIKSLELKTGFVIVLQFATHPSGNLAMIFRAHNPRTSVEAPPISDVIFLQEVENNADVIPRFEVLFENIHKALHSIQTINPKKMMEVIH